MDKANYLDRAKALIKRNCVRAGTLAILPLSAMVADQAQAQSPSPLQITQALDNFASGSAADSRPDSTTFAYATTPTGVKFSGGFDVFGTEWQSQGYGSPFRFRLNSNLTGPITPGTSLNLAWNFTATFTGGSVTVEIYNNLDPNDAPPDQVESRSNDTGLFSVASGVTQT